MKNEKLGAINYKFCKAFSFFHLRQLTAFFPPRAGVKNLKLRINAVRYFDIRLKIRRRIIVAY